MKLRIDPVSTPGLNYYAPFRRGMLLDDLAELTNRTAWLHEGDCFFETLASGFDETNSLWVCAGLGTDVVGFVKVGVVAAVVEGDVEVEDVAVEEDALVGDAVADDLVGRCAEGFGEVVVIER